MGVFSPMMPHLARDAKASHSERKETLLRAWPRVQRVLLLREENASVAKGIYYQPLVEVQVATCAIQDPEVMEMFAKNAPQILIQALIVPSAWVVLQDKDRTLVLQNAVGIFNFFVPFSFTLKMISK